MPHQCGAGLRRARWTIDRFTSQRKVKVAITIVVASISCTLLRHDTSVGDEIVVEPVQHQTNAKGRLAETCPNCRSHNGKLAAVIRQLEHQGLKVTPSLCQECPHCAYDRHEKAGCPHEVAWYARCSLPCGKYSASYVGGGSALFGHGRDRFRDGVWGMDYRGFLLPQKIWLRWTHGRRYQGGTGQYETDGPNLVHELQSVAESHRAESRTGLTERIHRD